MNIKEIARLSGFSVATVSRVINNSSKVSEKTREKILKVMKEYDYSPNNIARQLSTNTVNYIGVVVADISNSFFSSIIQNISSELLKIGYNVLLFDSAEDVELEVTNLEVIYSQKIAGLIITPVSRHNGQTRDMLKKFKSRNIPIVFIDRDLVGFETDIVLVDNIKGAYEATEWLIKTNKRKIGIITGPDESLPALKRFEGYKQALIDNEIVVDENLVMHGDFRFESGYRLTKELTQRHPEIEAIFVSNNLMTLGAAKYLYEEGIKIPEEITVFGFDNVEYFEWFNIRIPAVERSIPDMAKEAVHLLMDRIERDNFEGVKEVTLDTNLVLKNYYSKEI